MKNSFKTHIKDLVWRAGEIQIPCSNSTWSSVSSPTIFESFLDSFGFIVDKIAINIINSDIMCDEKLV